MANGREEEFVFEAIKPGDTSEAWCRELKIVFMLQGNGWLHMEDADSAYAVSGEDIFVINSFQLHSIVLEDKALAIALLLSPSFLAAFSPETGIPGINCKSFLHGEDRQQLFDLLRRDLALAFRAWYKKESELSIHLRSRVAALLDDLLRNFLNTPKGTGCESGRERLRTAVNYIHANYRENITLADLSAHTYLSGSYISRSFQKYLGVSFTGYLTQVRLLHAAALLRGGQTITEIAYENGFSSASALIDAFKQYNGITPGQYRRNMAELPQRQSEPAIPALEGFSTSFASLMKYADQPEAADVTQVPAVCEITAHIGSIRRPLRHTWKTMINGGYAREMLNPFLQEQIRELQETVGFRYIRCKGILDDDMMLYTRDIYGAFTVNYVYLDQLLDFLLSVGAKPILEMGHMPSALARRKSWAFKRPVCISPPEDNEKWRLLVLAVMEHLTDRYGIEEMKHWLFAPWLSVEFSSFGLFTLEEYTAAYVSSYKVIKGICSGFLIYGPGCTVSSAELRKWFFTMCREQDCMPDIYAIRSYATIYPDEEQGGLELAESNETFHMAVSGDEDYLAHSLQNIRSFLEQEGLGDMPVMLDEWSNNIWQRDLCNDTSYKSAYIFKNVTENHDRFYGMGYFNVSDQLDEIAPAAELFQGSFGLFARNGMPKSAYRAMQLLSQAGEKLIAKGKGYFITASESEVQIFLYNYCHYDMLYRYRNNTNLTKTERYRVFNETPPLSCHIQLEGFRPGKHSVRRYSIGPRGGSTYDAWVDMGAPEPMTRDEEERLRRLSYPVYRTETLEAGEFLKIKAWLLPHEVQLITISI